MFFDRSLSERGAHTDDPDFLQAEQLLLDYSLSERGAYTAQRIMCKIVVVLDRPLCNKFAHTRDLQKKIVALNCVLFVIFRSTK